MIKLTPKKNLNEVSFGISKSKLKLDNSPCAKCKTKCGAPLYNQKPKEAPKGTRLMVITEWAHHKDAGYSPAEYRLLHEALRKVAFDHVYITPVVKCDTGKTPTKPIIEKCEGFLRSELDRFKPNVVICIGKAAASVFNISGRIDKLKFGAYLWKETKVIVTYSFDAILEDYRKQSDLFKAFKKAEKFTTNEDAIELNYEMFENANEFSEWADAAIGQEALLAFDIETTGLDYYAEDARVRTISFSPRPGRSVVIPYDESYHEPL